MTVASEITRLQWAKASARTSIINKWVNVPANVTVDTYHTYIDQISTWVPQDKYEIALSAWAWTIIWYPIEDVQNSRWATSPNSYFCNVWNYIFMIWEFGEGTGTTPAYFNWKMGIYYKAKWETTWNRITYSFRQISSRDYIWFNISIVDPVYISSDNSINMKTEIRSWWQPWQGSLFYEGYHKWIINTNSINISSQLAWEDLNNYKMYDSETFVWDVHNDQKFIGYRIKDPLI